MKRFIVTLVVALLSVIGAVWVAVAQDEPLSALLQPLAIDVMQDTPVNVTVAIETESGVITTTTPLTVSVALRVHIDGPGVVTVEPLAAEAPTVVVETEDAAVSPGSGELIDDFGIPYTVEAPAGVEIIQWTAKTNFMDSLEIAGELRNDTQSELRFVTVLLSMYDANGKLIDTATGMATRSGGIPPGGTSPIMVMTEVDPGEVATYKVQVQ